MVNDHKIQENQSIYDIANINLGGFDNIYIGLITLNPALTSIDFDLNSIASQSIKYDDAYYSSSTIQIQLNIGAASTKKEVSGLENQSIYDLSITNNGNLENIYELLKENNIISINELNVGLKNIIFDNTKISNLTAVKTINKNGYKIATLEKISAFLLQENGFYLLQENGYKIKL